MLATLTVLLSFTHYLGLEERGIAFSALSIAGAIGLFDLGVSIGGVRRVAEKTSTFGNAPTIRSKWAMGRRFFAVRGILKFLFAWQAVAAVFYLTFMLGAGEFFQVTAHSNAYGWYQLYAVLCAIGFFVVPFSVLLEGFGRVDLVYSVRAISDVAFAVFLIVALWAGIGLVSIVVAQGARLLVQVFGYLCPTRGIAFPTLRLFSSKTIKSENFFRGDGGSFQFMLAATWIVGFFITQITVPALNRVAGSETAGSYGSLLFFIAGLSSLSLIHPLMMFSQNARNHARGDGALIHRNYLASVGYSWGVFFMGLCTAALFVKLDFVPDQFKEFTLGGGEVALVFWIGFCQMNIGVVASYFRAVGVERFFLSNILLAFLNISGLFLLTGPGEITDYLIFMSVVFGVAFMAQYWVFFQSLSRRICVK